LRLVRHTPRTKYKSKETQNHCCSHQQHNYHHNHDFKRHAHNSQVNARESDDIHHDLQACIIGMTLVDFINEVEPVEQAVRDQKHEEREPDDANLLQILLV